MSLLTDLAHVADTRHVVEEKQLRQQPVQMNDPAPLIANARGKVIEFDATSDQPVGIIELEDGSRHEFHYYQLAARACDILGMEVAVTYSRDWLDEKRVRIATIAPAKNVKSQKLSDYWDSLKASIMGPRKPKPAQQPAAQQFGLAE